ncbi:hypothetical protein LCGC14_0689580 [marine sediment metagenome]|uniref:Radical SAM core domain-containing protein n=1 Tax=marine sediment metagenome TaxID=412755 RepID=A0A0F9R697_9ZZZZ
MLKNAREILETVSNSYFKRYDLDKEWSQFTEQVNNYRNTIGREPFMFEIINKLLVSIEDSIKNQVLYTLYQKDKEWFFNTGQFFLYNLSQWITNFNNNGSGIVEHQSIPEFTKKWWSKFLELENECEKIKNETSFPKKILLELTNNCNLNCIMCGIGKNVYEPSRNLPIDLLFSLSENVLKNTDLIRLNGLGESTILPNFLEYLNILSELPAQLEIVTNLTVANNKIWDKLLENNTTFLISCDSSSSKLYESIRRGASFTGFKKNLKYIGANISNPLQGQIIFTLMESNVLEITKVVELAAEMSLGGVIINVVKADPNQNGWLYQQFENIKEQFQYAYNLAESFNIVLKLPDHIGNLPISKSISNLSCQLHCNNPWEEVYIRYNGDLTVCNMLNPYIYGNCQNYSFDEVWNGLNAKLFRRFVNTEFRHYYCRNCYYLV